MATIWCALDLPDEALAELRGGTAGYELTREPSAAFTIALGQPDPAKLLTATGLRLVQITTAGYTRYDTEEFRREIGVPVCNSSSVFDEPCAQHLLAMMLALARQLPQTILEQAGDKGWPADRIRSDSRLLRDQKVLLVGYGAIARRVAELLAPFGLDLVAVRRSVRGDETVPTYPIEKLDELLTEADHVANILPANASTDRIFDGGRFAAMKPGAIFYNIGRGTTVVQDALVQALTAGRLAAAYLDVTDPEPLPSEHPLWTVPNCWITPHTAGGHGGEWTRLVRHFLGNLRRFEAGEPLVDRVM
jgi:phosphoglycerate dehydrogenase-like enzyme